MQCLTFRWIEAASASSVFGVVMDEHVVRHSQHVAVYVHRSGNHHLESQSILYFRKPQCSL